MNKKIISIFILLTIIANTYSIAYYWSIPSWPDEQGILAVNANPENDFLNIESQGAILIEQKTRRGSI